MNKLQIDREFFLKHRYAVISALVVLAIIIGVLIQKSEGNASVILSVGNAGTEIVLDETLHSITKRDGERVSLSFSGGDHLVLAAKSGHYPWAKEIDFERGDKFKFDVFNLLETTETEEVAPEASEYEEIKTSLSTYELATKDSPLKSKGGKIEAYAEGNMIVVTNTTSSKDSPLCARDECVENFTLIERPSDIEQIFFLPNYENVLLFRDSDGIYALEISRIGIRNFQPLTVPSTSVLSLYKGDFYSLVDDTVFKLIIE